MFEKWTSHLKTIFNSSEPGGRVRIPFWRKTGPTWYLSTWWPGESLDSMQYSLLSLLAVAHEERLDPKPLIAALADEHRGRYRRRLRLLAKRLDSKTTIVPALEKTPYALSDSVVLSLRFGSQSGILAQTYKQLIDTEKPQVDEYRTTQSNARGYSAVLAGTMALILTFFMFFIFPTIKKMFDEFELKLPIAFQSLAMFVELVSSSLLLVVLAFFALGWLVWSYRSRRFFRRQVADRVLGRSSLLRSSQLLRMLSVAVEAGRPLAGSLSTLAKYHFDKNIRQRLLSARNEVEQGVPAWTSLVDAKIISPDEFQALSASSSSRDQSWTLRQLATVKQAISDQRVLVRTAFIQPIVILIFASVVLWICFSFLSVLANLITSLAG